MLDHLPSRRARRELARGARQLPQKRLVVGTTGSASVRTGGLIHLTPSRVPYETMRARDIVTVDEHGASRRDRRVPSREMPMHLAIHAARPDVRAILHTHTPHAVAWSMLAPELTPEIEDAHYFSTGTIRVAPACPAGSRVLAAAAVRQLGSGCAVLLERHGAVTVGEDVPAAIAVAEAVEHMAHVALLLRCARLGLELPATELPA